VTCAAIIIPARYASTRLPGKPLLSETGKPIIQHTYEQAMKCRRASSVIVATDDQRIFDVVSSFGGRAVMTSRDHATGSERIAEAAADLDAEIIVNLQGDEPEIDPDHLDFLISIQKECSVFASTLACPFSPQATAGPGSPDDCDAVKVILSQAKDRNIKVTGAHYAKYFTRNICAHPRDGQGRICAPDKYFLHIGVYAYSRASLIAFAAAPKGALEQPAQLEQLRILEMGEKIAVGVVAASVPGIDTAEDYARFVARYSKP